MTQVEHSEREKLVEWLNALLADCTWCEGHQPKEWGAISEAASALLRVGEELEEWRAIKAVYAEAGGRIDKAERRERLKAATSWLAKAGVSNEVDGKGLHIGRPGEFAADLIAQELDLKDAEARATAAEAERDYWCNLAEEYDRRALRLEIERDALRKALEDLLDHEIAHVGPFAGQRVVAARAALSTLKDKS